MFADVWFKIMWFCHIATFSYLTFKIMGFGMKYRKEWPHVKEVLELWAAFCNSLQVGPIFAGHIHTKKVTCLLASFS